MAISKIVKDTKKRMSLWPLPGGRSNYTHTLENCLSFVSKNNPSYKELKQWFIDTMPNLTGKKATVGYVYVINNVLEFTKKQSDRMSVTKEGLTYLKTKDKDFLYKVLDSKVLGIEDILTMLQTGPYTSKQIDDMLKEKLKVKWATRHQTMYRLGWLLALYKIKMRGMRYSLIEPQK